MPVEAPTTMADLLIARADDDHVGLRFEDRSWTWREVVAESADRASLALDLRRPGPFHVGILLENVPEYVFWLGAMALVGGVAVGINPTRRGSELARDIKVTDCQLLVTDGGGLALLDGLQLGARLEDERILRIDQEYGACDRGNGPEHRSMRREPRSLIPRAPTADDLFLLLFTSGTTGDPKAVRCTQGRLASIAARCVEFYGFRRDDVFYCPMPLFHGNALMVLWGPSVTLGATVALARRFSATGFLPDVRRHGATVFTYVGKALSYVLATGEREDDADNSLRRGFGTEASERDRQDFERRFGCELVEGYGSSEGGVAINRGTDTPAGALGRAMGDIAVVNPETGRECPRGLLDGAGRLLNPEAAIGEIVNRSGRGSFEGYYGNPDAEAERFHDGWYWTGDLAYRDTDGFFWFVGRRGDWMRVDSENMAAGPIERVLVRHPDVEAVAVYGVADSRSGEQVMAALELRHGTSFDPLAFSEFLAEQEDLGTKWAPRFVRIVGRLPLTATNKVTKTPLRQEGWTCTDAVYWLPRRSGGYRRLTEEDRRALDDELLVHRGS